MKTNRRAFLIAHVIASFFACPAFVALDVFVYRPVHFSQPEHRKGALALVVVSPLAAPLLLFGTPLGLALHGTVPHMSWICVAIAYVILEFILFRLFRPRSGNDDGQAVA